MTDLSTQASLWLQLLQQYRAIAVIRSPQLQLGLALAKAVATGGIRIIEITWNSSQPGTLIKRLKTELPECTIGTGTILTVEQLHSAVDAGVQFLFSPHVNQSLIEAAVTAEVPIVPGALTPTEIISAWQAGASCVKVFPVGTVGGANYIKSLQGPLGQIPLIPTGGVTLENARQFIDAGALAVGLSSQLFPAELIEKQDWQAIAQRAKTLCEQFQKIK
ncbi:MAG: bifunctional 4-hydroxy-2-oxoglutarate aldolase/2-dehydro-3-deoxy-phosphogluconate aldolase [Cyanophyceae cyanobacterium]